MGALAALVESRRMISRGVAPMAQGRGLAGVALLGRQGAQDAPCGLLALRGDCRALHRPGARASCSIDGCALLPGRPAELAHDAPAGASLLTIDAPAQSLVASKTPDAPPEGADLGDRRAAARAAPDATTPPVRAALGRLEFLP